MKNIATQKVKEKKQQTSLLWKSAFTMLTTTKDKKLTHPCEHMHRCTHGAWEITFCEF